MSSGVALLVLFAASVATASSLLSSAAQRVGPPRGADGAQEAALSVYLSEPRVRERRTSGSLMLQMQRAGNGSANNNNNNNRPAVYTNQFVIQVKGGQEEARKLAAKHGFVYLNHILDDYYHLEHARLAKRSLNATRDGLNTSIEDEPQVLALERQVLKQRFKRDFLELAPPGSGQRLRPANQGRPPHHQLLRPANQARHQFTRPANQAPALAFRVRPSPPPSPSRAELAEPGEPLDAAASSSPAGLQLSLAPGPRQPRPPLNGSHPAPTNASKAPFNDPSWPLLWYLDGGARNGFDLNVVAAWKMGFTGKGIVITILDDGLEKDHPDLQANYDPLASFDINNDDADPMPRYDAHDSNRHGTRCAGEVAAVPDNNICSIGIAYNSKVGGVRMLDGDVTDAVEARSLGLNNQHIHIYSASWGPDDNGKTVDGPGELATRAFIEGVTNGRQGLGSIFVFASGNGGREHDNCNCDGYTNSIWTLSISSATENGYIPWYIEACSSTLATTYSSGSHDERQIATTDLHHSCTPNHTGTSASAPLAAGICALVLESNPRLTWRDMQHIVVRTARPANLIAKDWRTNAMGRNVSHAFGYGLMDAAAMILMAQKWITVPVQYTCEVRSPQMDKLIPAKGFIELKLRAECANVRFLEHVQSKVTLTSSRRGDLHIYLISPHGTRSTLLAQRPNDQAEQGFRSWPFMTVHSWGESPNGVWTLEVHNDGKPQNLASLKEWTLILYGTSSDPNKHLDASAQPSNPTQQQQPSARVRPSTPSASTDRPRPTSSPPPSPLAPIDSLSPNLHASDGLTKWSPQAPVGVPGPISSSKPPMSAPSPPDSTPLSAGSSSSSTSSTSTSTYISSTFKSISSSHSTPQTSSSPPYSTSAPSRPQTTTDYIAPTDRTSTGNADFEVVSAPNGATVPSSTLKTSITLMDNNKIDSTIAPKKLSSSTVSPSITTTISPIASTGLGLDLEGNQIDLKLGKDYRSSGDQNPNSPIRVETNHMDATETKVYKSSSDLSQGPSYTSQQSSASLPWVHFSSYISIIVPVVMQIYLNIDYKLVRQAAASE